MKQYLTKKKKQADILIKTFLKYMDIPEIPITKIVAAETLADTINEFRENYNYQIKLAKKLVKLNKKG